MASFKGGGTGSGSGSATAKSTAFSSDSAFRPKRRLGVWALSSGIVLLYLFTFLRVRARFEDGFGNSDLLTNWLMGLSLTAFVCVSLMSVVFLLSELFELSLFGFDRYGSSKTPVTQETPKFSKPEVQSRRRFVSNLATMIAALPLAGSVYGMWRGKYAFTVREVALSFPDLPAAFDGFKIAQFSDFHSGSFDNKKAVENGLALINEQKADVIVFTGDWINEFAGELNDYVPMLEKLQAPFGKFGVLGNHDFGGGRINDLAEGDTFEDKREAVKEAEAANLETLKEKIAQTGFELLNNAHRNLKREGEQINLIGVENWGHAPFPQLGDLDKATAGCAEGFNVLLSHDPTHWEEKVLPHQRNFHLTLSGHTHGSQVGIERAWLKWSPVQYVYERWAGLYTEQRQHLYVNRGFGFIGYAGRVGIPPEITLFTLRKA